MITLVLGILVGLAAGFGLTVWFYPKNKAHMKFVEDKIRQAVENGNEEAKKVYQHVKNDLTT